MQAPLLVYVALLVAFTGLGLTLIASNRNDVRGSWLGALRPHAGSYSTLGSDHAPRPTKKWPWWLLAAAIASSALAFWLAYFAGS